MGRCDDALADLSLIALTETDLYALFLRAVTVSCEALGADYASVLELQAGGTALRLCAGMGWTPVGGEVVAELGESSPAARAIRADGPVLVEHGEDCEAPAPDSLLGRHGVASSAAMVIRGQDGPFGVVSVHSRLPHAFDRSDLLFLRAVANILASAIPRTRAEVTARQLAAVVETSHDAIVSRRVDGTVTSWNKAAERLFGYTAEEIVGRNIDILAPPERRAELDDVNQRLTRGERVDQFETVRVRKDGTLVHVASTVSPIKDSSGAIVAASAISRDITRQKEAQEDLEHVLAAERDARASAERARERMSLLIDASDALAASLDYEQTLTDLARLLASRLADGCIIDVVDEAGEIVRLAVVHRDPEQEARIREIQSRLVPDSTRPRSSASVIASGEPLVVPEADAALFDETARGDDRAGALIHALNITSVMCLPLRARDRTVGAIWFIASGHSHTFDDADLSLAQELARRAAGTIENARLYVHARTEIDHRRRAEDALRESEEQYRVLFEGNPTPMWVFDTETLRFLAVNEAAVKSYGYSREEFLGMTVEGIRLPEDVPNLRRALRVHATSPERGLVDARTWRHRCKDGSLIDVDISSHSTTFEGRPARVVLATDVTERVRADRALRESEARYRDLFENANDLIATVDLDSRLTSVNAAFASSLGYSPEELVGRSIRDLVPSEWHEVLERAARRKQDGEGQATTYEHELLARDGRRIAVEVSSRLIDEHGRAVGTQAVCRDITERRAAERALHQSQELYRLVVENSMDMISILDQDGRLVYASSSHTEGLGYAPEELVGRVAADFIHPDDLVAALAAFAAAVNGSRGVPDRPVRLKHKDGRYIATEGTASVIRDAEGGQGMILATYRDVSDRERAGELAEQLRQAQKMEAIGRLAGGIAHDFNNLLTVIQGYSEVALAADDLSGARSAVEEVAVAAKSAAALTGQLLAFSRQQVLQPQVLDLSGVVTSTEGLLRRLLGEDVELVVRVAPGARPIVVDPSQIEQVLLNLAVNSREAMPDGGTLEIDVTNVDVDDASIHVGLEAGPYVSIAVGDTGEGMDEETRSRIFEPFFTTKTDGTGLGLATVHGVVTQSGGHVMVDSSPGVGTTFRMLFPAAEQDLEIEAGGEGSPLAAEECAKTILLVEDEDPVRTLTARVLTDSGYTVLAAATADEAVDIASEWCEPLHLILSDMTLPGRSGRDLAVELRLIHPEAKSLLISGYASAVHQSANGDDDSLLPKPFTAAGLTSKVREILAA